MHWATRSWLSEVAKGRCHRNRNIHRPEPPLHAAHTPGSDRRFCSLSCARSQTPCRDPPFPRRLAGEPRTAAFHPSPNTPSTASLPPKKTGESVTHVSGTMCYLCLRPLTFQINGLQLWVLSLKIGHSFRERNHREGKELRDSAPESVPGSFVIPVGSWLKIAG